MRRQSDHLRPAQLGGESIPARADPTGAGTRPTRIWRTLGAVAVAGVLLHTGLAPGQEVNLHERPPRGGAPTNQLPNYDVRLDRSARAESAVRDGDATPGTLLATPGQICPTSAIARLTAYLRHHPKLGVDPADVLTARHTRYFTTAHNGLTHVTLQQQHLGLDIIGARLRGSVTRTGQIVSMAGSIHRRTPGGLSPRPFATQATKAVQIAMRAAGVDQTPELDRDVCLRRVYFPLTASELIPAWEVVVPARGTGNVYEVILDAGTGQLLRRWNQRQHATTESVSYRIFDADSPAPGSPGSDAPTGTQFPFISSDLLLVDPATIGPWSPSGWIDDGNNETTGNNVDAHLDLNGDDIPDLPRTAGLPYRVFDYLSSHPSQSPSDYRDASVVQLFYLCNVFHDRLYELGFDEAAHNFQLDNFGLGGTGGDPILADAQDNADVNTASFTTGAADGTAARLQIHLFIGPAPDRDAAFERDLVFHELAHGVSLRLLEALPVGEQPQALSEGWSDFLALALGAESGDDPHAPYPFAPYISYLYDSWSNYQDNYYFGLRRFPYCTDLNKNPLTYTDIDPAQASHPPAVPINANITTPASERHNAGEVWCMALMECRAELMDRHGFSGNQMMLQLVIDGMMLSPSTPTFLDARDAILSADLVNNSGGNLDILWTAFAKRGLGVSAASPTTAVQGIVEAFDIPDAIVFGYPAGQPTNIPPGQPETFAVHLHPLGASSPTPGTELLYYSIDGGPFVNTPLVPTGTNTFNATLPAANCGSQYDYYIRVDDAVLGTVTDPPSAPTTTFRAFAAYETGIAFFDDMETDPGWTVGAPGDDAIRGLWNRMDPEGTDIAGTVVQSEEDVTSDPGVICWVTDGRAGNTVGDNDVDGGKTTLTSPIFAVTGQDAMISYWRWYSNDEGPSTDDIFEVFLSSDGGGNWQPVETVGPVATEASGGWFYHEFLASDVLTPGTNMQLRFVASDYGGSSLVEAAVDDLTVTVFYCAPATPGDANRDGLIDLADHAVFVTCLAGVDTAPPQNPPNCLEVFDFDADLDVDHKDFAAFQTLVVD